MKSKWYLKNFLNDLIITFLMSLIISLITTFISETRSFEEITVWCIIFSVITAIIEIMINGLVTRKITQNEKNNIIEILQKLNYHKYIEGNVIKFKNNNWLYLFSDVIIITSDNESNNTILMSRMLNKKIEYTKKRT